MNKSIYEEALETVTTALDLQDRSVIFKHTILNELKKVIERAEKQEKLLELYRELRTVKNKIIFLALSDDDYDDIENIEMGIEKQIKELENDK